MPGRSRSRSRSRGKESRVSEAPSSEPRNSEAREEDCSVMRRRKRRTGWDVGGGGEPANPTDPAAAAAIAAAAASRINSGGIFTPALTTAGGMAIPGRSPQAPHPSMCRIYVGSLDYYLTELEIKSVFQAFGTVTSVDMPKEGDRSKGFCFVEYASPEAAQMALSTMHNFVLKGRTIKVGRPTAVGAGQPQQLLARPSPNMSLVSSAQAGAAAATAILASRGGQTPQGDVAGLMAMGQLSPEKPQEATQGSNRIYVGNVPFGFSSEDLKKIFVCFGAILTCQLLPSQENPQQHRGYGFIEFASADAAKLAIDTMNGFEVVGKQLKVNYATALRSAAVAGSLGVGMGAQLSPLFGQSAAAAAPAAAAAAAPTAINDLSAAAQGATGANTTPLGSAAATLGFQPAAVAPPASPPPAAAASSSAASDQQQQQQQAASGGDAAAAAAAPTPFPEKPAGEPGSSSVLLLTNTVAPEEVDDDLKEEMREECRRYGEVDSVRVKIIKNDVRIFVAFAETAGAAAAAPQLHGRWFGGRQIRVTFYDMGAFRSGNLEL
ncbi:hypothetical protein Esti_005804 [Eimeria stiedai]